MRVITTNVTGQILDVSPRFDPIATILPANWNSYTDFDSEATLNAMKTSIKNQEDLFGKASEQAPGANKRHLVMKVRDYLMAHSLKHLYSNTFFPDDGELTKMMKTRRLLGI